MSTNTLYQRASETVIKRLGEPVAYLAKTGMRYDIHAVIDKFVDEYGVAVGNRRFRITLVRADTPHITRGERIVSEAGVQYQVEDVLDDDGFVIEVSASRV